MNEKERRTRRRAARNSRPTGAIGFVLRFVAFWLGSLLLLGSVPAIESWSVRSTVACLRAALAVLTGSAAVNGDTVSAAGISFSIISDCTPLLPTSLFFSACLAFPAGWRWKAAGVAGSAALLWVYNLIRVLVLFWVKARWPGAFDFVHVYLWQTATLIVVFLLFVLWLRAQARGAAPPSEPGPALAPSSAVAGR
jgi:exosortase/archaeosortase family protein